MDSDGAARNIPVGLSGASRKDGWQAKQKRAKSVQSVSSVVEKSVSRLWAAATNAFFNIRLIIQIKDVLGWTVP